MLESNSKVDVAVTGVKIPNPWTTKTGGQIEADDQKFSPGGMLPEISLGGPVSTENVTVTRLFDKGAWSLYRLLRPLVGRGVMSVTYTPFDVDGNAFSTDDQIVISGKLIRLTPPDADAGSNDPAMLELEMSSNSSA